PLLHRHVSAMNAGAVEGTADNEDNETRRLCRTFIICRTRMLYNHRKSGEASELNDPFCLAIFGRRGGCPVGSGILRLSYPVASFQSNVLTCSISSSLLP